MAHTRRAAASLVAVLAAVGVGVGLPDVAGADPATPVSYPAASSATRVQGRFFDTCTAPSLTALAAWRGTSPYTGVNIYFGGRNRGCAQPNLTAAWVRSAATAGWSLVPTYFGDQPFCVFGSKPYRYTASGAAARGSADGARRRLRGPRPGTPPGQRPLRRRRALRPHRRLLRLRGAHLRLGVDPGPAPQRLPRRRLRAPGLRSSRPGGKLLLHLAGATGCRVDGAVGQRRHADRLAHRRATPGGPSGSAPSSTAATTTRPGAGCPSTSTATSSRDPSRPSPSRTASPAPRCSTCAAGRPPPPRSSASSRRAAPSPSSARPVGSRSGPRRSGTASAPVATCPTATCPRHPRRASAPPSRAAPTPGQITTSTPVNTRSGPGTTYTNLNQPLQGGALAYVACQKSGSLVGTTRVWNQLVDGRWVTDYYVSNRSNTTYSTPVPRCP